jgi:hypothetical protein
LAYNGLDYTDVLALIKAFQQSCKCKLGKVVINAGVLSQQDAKDAAGIEAISDVKIFLAAFSESLSLDIRETDLKLGISLAVFPLLHFNNELFLRSIYYLLSGKSDQSYSNNYKFQLTDGMMQRLKKKKLQLTVNKQVLAQLQMELRADSVELAILIPPFHPAYVKNVSAFSVYIDDIRQAAQDDGVVLYDHSRLFKNDPDYFADPVHINKTGQEEYTKYLSEEVLQKEL